MSAASIIDADANAATHLTPSLITMLYHECALNPEKITTQINETVFTPAKLEEKTIFELLKISDLALFKWFCIHFAAYIPLKGIFPCLCSWSRELHDYDRRRGTRSSSPQGFQQ